jgi:hypothetical protein
MPDRDWKAILDDAIGGDWDRVAQRHDWATRNLTTSLGAPTLVTGDDEVTRPTWTLEMDEYDFVEMCNRHNAALGRELVESEGGETD